MDNNIINNNLQSSGESSPEQSIHSISSLSDEQQNLNSAAPSEQGEKGAISEPSYYDKIGQTIEQDPRLQASWNKWFSENILNVPAAPVGQPSNISPQPTSQEELSRQWQQLYEQDPIGTTALLIQKQLEQQKTEMQKQWSTQLQPINNFVAQLAKTNFDQSVKNNPEYNEVKAVYSNAISQIPPEQIQANPQILEVVYNSIVGQMYRQGKLTGLKKGIQTPTMSNIPGSATPNIPNQAVQVSKLSQEEHLLLQRYGVSPEDYIKYGEVKRR